MVLRLKGGGRMNHIGTKTLETERLILRKFKDEDASDLFNNWANDSNVTKYLTWPTHENLDTSKYVIGLWLNEYSNSDHYNWCIELKEDGQAIGAISVVSIDENVEAVEIGYCIGKEYWNKGIVTEAFLSIIKFLFEEVDVKRIVAKHDTNNPASGAVMKKCGLKFEGVNRKAGKNNTGICDMAVYSILKEEYLMN